VKDTYTVIIDSLSVGTRSFYSTVRAYEVICDGFAEESGVSGLACLRRLVEERDGIQPRYRIPRVYRDTS